jgi:hypothetical protein
MLVPLEKSTSNLVLQINREETIYMVTCERGTIGVLQSGDDNYESVDYFKYLGLIFTTENDVSVDIKHGFSRY